MFWGYRSEGRHAERLLRLHDLAVGREAGLLPARCRSGADLSTLSCARMAISLAEKWKPYRILVEVCIDRNSSGTGSFNSCNILTVKPVPVEHDKVGRV